MFFDKINKVIANISSSGFLTSKHNFLFSPTSRQISDKLPLVSLPSKDLLSLKITNLASTSTPLTLSNLTRY